MSNLKFMAKMPPSKALPRGIKVSGKVFANNNTTGAVLDRVLQHQIDNEIHRGHMGLSSIADKDLRASWLKFRWSLPDAPSPRINRLFNLGNIIEDEVIRLLREIPGVTLHDVDPKTGKQWRFSYCGGHVGGSMDGKILGVPEAPKTEHVFECKSANDSKFKELVKLGSIEKWNPTYFGQAQNYMGASGLKRALFGVYNKNNSDMYWERIYPVTGYFDAMLERCQDLLELYGPPDSCYTSRNHFEIKRLKSEKYQRVYWGDELPAPNCRNCKHAVVEFDGLRRWSCKRWQKDLSIQDQNDGCDLHLYLPPLFPGKKIQDHGTIVRYKTNDNTEIWNAEDPDKYKGSLVYNSVQLHAISEQDMLSKALKDSTMNNLIKAVDGEIA